MTKKPFVIPTFLKQVIFAVLPMNGYRACDLITLFQRGIETARGVGQHINSDDTITGGVQIFSSETGMFSAYAAVLASYCQDKWRIADYPYATIPMTGLVASEDPGDEPRMEFLRGLMPPPSMETQCLVLVVSEAQSLVMPNALCQLAGFPQRYDEFKNGVLSPYRFLSVTVDMQTGGVSFVKNEKADW